MIDDLDAYNKRAKLEGGDMHHIVELLYLPTGDLAAMGALIERQLEIDPE